MWDSENMAAFSPWPNMLGWSSGVEFQKLWKGIISSLTQEKSGVAEEDTKLEVETIRALTTLLLQSKLCISGNPLTSFPHLPRQREIIFLKNSLGRRLLQVRQLAEGSLTTRQAGAPTWVNSSSIQAALSTSERQPSDSEPKKVGSLHQHFHE